MQTAGHFECLYVYIPPQANGQVERYNRTILAMLRNYVSEHQSDWEEYASALTYAYHNHVHRSTSTTPFDLMLSRPPPAFSLYHNSRGVRKATDEQREHDIEKLDAMIEKAYDRLLKTQRRYKRDFDKPVRTANRNIRAGEYVYPRRTVRQRARSSETMRWNPTAFSRTIAGRSSSNGMMRGRGLTRTA